MAFLIKTIMRESLDMKNDNRITFKCLGVFMEVINVTPEKFTAMITRVGIVLVCLVLAYRLPDIVHAFK